MSKVKNHFHDEIIANAHIQDERDDRTAYPIGEAAPNRSTETTYWQEGYKEFCRSHSVLANPYMFDTDEGIEWTLGWGAARQDQKQGRKS